MKRTILNLQWSTVLGVFLSVCTACGHKTGNGTGTTDSIPMAAAPEFNADSAFAYTAAQCAFGPRVPNTEAHRLCGTYIAEKFKSFGATVTDQYADVKAYDGTVLKARNIIASYNPDAKARILICGHWDSRPWADNDPDSANWHKPVLAANDAASDVAVMLEMARLIQLHPIEIGIDFICFDAEDYGVPQWSDQAGRRFVMVPRLAILGGQPACIRLSGALRHLDGYGRRARQYFLQRRIFPKIRLTSRRFGLEHGCPIRIRAILPDA